MTTKDRILDAAERIVLRDGVARLTMEAVAAEASLSKGGVLYNYPSKDDLIRGMIHRLIDMFETDMARFAEQDPDPVGRRTRAFLRALFPQPTQSCEQCSPVCAALLAAVATNRSLLDPLREHIRTWEPYLKEDGIDPVVAAMVRLAGQGLWWADLFGLKPPDPEVWRQVMERLAEFTRRRSQESGVRSQNAEVAAIHDDSVGKRER